ncbi:hypothetical protein BaRGS_00030725, partial [Batillaria attramentaria]
MAVKSSHKIHPSQAPVERECMQFRLLLCNNYKQFVNYRFINFYPLSLREDNGSASGKG